MENFIMFHIESGICLGTLYIVYLIFLRKETYFRVNRIYLIVSLIMSFIIPLISFSKKVIIPVSNNYIINEVTIPTVKISTTMNNFIDTNEILKYIYYTICSIFFILFLIRIISIYIIIIKSEKQKKGKHTIVITKEEIAPCSIFNFIIINKKFLNSDKIDNIIAHEGSHASQLHTIDLLFVEIIKIFQWFNPIVYLYKFSLVEIHEFLADKAVIDKTKNISDYKLLMLEHAIEPKMSSVTNNFNSSLTFKRINMLDKLKYRPSSLLKLLIAVPVLTLLLIIFACSKNQNSDNSDNYDFNSILDDKGQKQIPDTRAKFPGGWESYRVFEKQNLVYPEAAKKENVTGKINIRFYVEPDGSVSEVTIISAARAGQDWSSKLGFGCDEEAIRFVKGMPKWEPAMYKGKAYRKAESLGLIFGDKGIWEAKNPPSMIISYQNGNDSYYETTDKPSKNSVQSTKNNQMPQSPEFPGGEYKMVEFINSNIKYPESGRVNDISGLVMVSFTVEETGSISEIKIIKGINPDFDNEAIRVIKLMPKWSPCFFKEGQPVKSQLTIPIKFALKS